MARKLFDRIADDTTCLELSLQPRVVNAKDFELLDFSEEQVTLCLFSTTGDGWLFNVNLMKETCQNFDHELHFAGVPPTNSRPFFDLLNSEHAPNLSHIHYSVLALGDYNYPHFCRTGKTLDLRYGTIR